MTSPDPGRRFAGASAPGDLRDRGELDAREGRVLAWVASWAAVVEDGWYPSGPRRPGPASSGDLPTLPGARPGKSSGPRAVLAHPDPVELTAAGQELTGAVVRGIVDDQEAATLAALDALARHRDRAR